MPVRLSISWEIERNNTTLVVQMQRFVFRAYNFGFLLHWENKFEAKKMKNNNCFSEKHNSIKQFRKESAYIL